MALMMFPPKLLQWLGNNTNRSIQLSAFKSSAWFVTLHELGREQPVAEGSGLTPGEAIIKCWENYLTVSN